MVVATEKLIRWVVFDAVGTLMFAEPSVAEVYSSIGSRYGASLRIDDVKKRFRQAFANHELTHETSEQRELEFWKHVVSEVLGPVSDMDACFAELYEHFARIDSWRIDDSTRHVVKSLLENGIDVAIGSNFDSRLHDVLDADPVLCNVTTRFVSSEIGWRKPNARFFQAVVDRCQTPASEILMVGDDYENDYVGAKTAGLRAVLLTDDIRGHSSNSITDLLHVLDLCGISQ